MNTPDIKLIVDLVDLTERVTKMDKFAAQDDILKFLRWSLRKMVKSYWYDLELNLPVD